LALTKERKQEIIEQFRIHEADTGSPEVQIAILTERIKDLSKDSNLHLRRSSI